MIRVKNQKAIRRLAIRSFGANRRRNGIAVIAIMLTALLFTTIFTLSLGTVENIQVGLMREAGSSGQGVIKYITDDVFEQIKVHPLIKEISYNRTLADEVSEEALAKRHAELWYMDDIGLKQGFCEPTSGHKPVAEDEVIADTTTLTLLKVPQQEGATFTLHLVIHGKPVQRTFKLAGWYEGDPLFSAGLIITSRAYMEAHLDELASTYEKDHCLTGTVNAYITFNNSMELRRKLDKVIVESGYSVIEGDEHYVPSNVNWAYLSTNASMDPSTVILLLGALILIVLTGYLIIYNIFQLSVVQDIQFYGLLKTIGTTGKQIKRIIRGEAVLLSMRGIPAGLLLGFLLGKILVPRLINESSYAGMKVDVTPNPWIFIGSALFALLTIWLSTHKPGKIAASVSPVEAVKYTISDYKVGKTKKSKDGNKLINMARSNLGRNKKQTIIVMLSLTLSLVLLNTVFTFSQSISMESYVSSSIDTDYIVANNDYFQNKFCGIEDETSKELIEEVNKLKGFKEGGRIYSSFGNGFAVTDPENTEQGCNKNEKGDFLAEVFGLEDLPLSCLKVVDGKMDLDQLKTGDYILEGVSLDDNNMPEVGKIKYQIGDEVTLHWYVQSQNGDEDETYMSKTFKVLGHVEIHSRSNFTGIWVGEYNFYLPSETYLNMGCEPAAMNYVFNVQKDSIEETEQFLEQYTSEVDPTTNYASRTKYLKGFERTRNTVVMIGGAITFIVALVGVLNYINVNLTGILARCREFAMLESIGMTGRQLKKMLILEGLYYVLGTALFSIILASITSETLIRSVCNLVCLFNYTFIIWPVLAGIPIFMLLGIIIPLICYKYLNKSSIVERLREN